jgi:hypothetical protein
MRADILTAVQADYREQVDFIETLERIEASHKETLSSFKENQERIKASFDKAIDSFKTASPQIDNQEKVSDQEQKPSVESVDPLDNGQIDSANEDQIARFPNPGQTDVIRRRRGEHVGQKTVEENCVENFDSDGGEAKKNISESSDGNSVPCIPCMEKESVTSLCVPRSSGMTKIVEVKAGRANCFVCHTVASSRLNGT